jgi:lipopolysaccharide biosynthesis regulator YciM
MIYLYLGMAIVIALIVYFYYSSLRKKKIPRTNSLYTDALNAMVNGDLSNAISLLKQVVKQDSNHVRAYLQLGNILRKENPEQSLKIHQSLTVRPNLSRDIQVDIHTALAEDYGFISNYKKAIEEAKLVLSIEKRNLWALNFLINISVENQDWEEAIGWTKQLQKITGKTTSEDEAKFDVFKGLDYLKSGDFEKAKSQFEKGIKASPDYPPSYRYLGDVYEQTRELVKALENWEKYAFRELEKGKVIYSKIETALFDLGRYSEVEKFYRKILDLNPSNFEATIRLANVLEEKGEGGAALGLIESLSKQSSSDIRIDLMKLKLSLLTSNPVELARQVDLMLEKLLKIDEA